MIKAFKVVEDQHRAKFLVEWNKTDNQLVKGWSAVSPFVLICTKANVHSISRESNTISKGDIMQEGIPGHWYDDNPDNKWEVFAVCDHLFEVEYAFIAYAASEVKRLEIKKTVFESQNSRS